MTVNINGTTGVSLVQTGAIPSGTAVANGSFTGNVSITGASSYLNINGNNVSPYSGMMKNRIINGDFKIDQRFSGAGNNSIAGNQYVVDRWYTTSILSSRFRAQQNNTNGPGSSTTQTATGFQNYFGANTITANASFGATDQYFIAQAIEGLNIQDLNWGSSVASPATLSFWVYSSIAGTHGGCITNGPANRTYPFTYSINTANTWQYQTITVPGDTTGSWFSNNGIGMYVLYNLGSGSSFLSSSPNQWQAGFYQTPTNVVQPQSAANGSFYLTGVQLEKGLQATPFEFRHYTTELQLCQRYYETSEATFSNPMWNGYCVNGASQYAPAFFKVTKRAAPSVILTSTFASLFANTSGGAVLIAVDSFYESRNATGTGQGHFSSQFRASAELQIQN